MANTDFSADKARARAGFFGSSRSDVRVIFHANPSADLEAQRNYTTIEVSGRDDTTPEWSVVAAMTYNSLDTAGGSWTVALKLNRSDRNPLDTLRENDWVEIEFWQGNDAYHVITGLIDQVTEQFSSGAHGTEVVYTVEGRGFGKIFETAIVYFNAYSDTTDLPSVTQVLLDMDKLAQSRQPAEIVRLCLFGFLQKLQGLNRSVILAPKTLSGCPENFSTIQLLDTRSHHGYPDRAALFLEHGLSSAPLNVWSLAKQWSDPLLCELYCDLGPISLGPGSVYKQDETFQRWVDGQDSTTERLYGPKSDYVKEFEPMPLGTLAPRVYFRDLPFPTFHSLPEYSGSNSPWFREITEYRIGAHQIAQTRRLARSGLNRVNTLLVNGNFLHDVADGYPNLLIPLMNKDDVRDYGMRIASVESSYGLALTDINTASATKIAAQAGVARDYRDIVKDYLCLNHEYLSGTLPIIPGRPDIRIGSKLVVEALNDIPETSFYVNAVQHTYTAGQPLLTTLTVSHGIRGGDSEYLSKLSKTSAKFELGRKVSDSEIERFTLASDGSAKTDAPVRTIYIGESGPLPTGSTIYEQFIPGTQAYIEKIRTLCSQIGLPDLSMNRYLGGIIIGTHFADADTNVAGENATGFIGQPNTYGYPLRGLISHMHEWADVHSDINSGVQSDVRSKEGLNLRACGYGQLIPANMERYQPEGGSRAYRYGETDPELIAWLRYVTQDPRWGGITPEENILAAFRTKVTTGVY